MRSDGFKLLMGLYFYPRGGSAHACRSIALALARNGLDVTLLAGSRSDCEDRGLAEEFFAGCEVRAVDFTPALRSDDPLAYRGGPGTAPMHGSYEDRPDAEDPVFATLDEDAFELQVEAWAAELESAGGADADLLYLHHLTPLNEAAARVAGDVPVIGHVHGSELLMLERLAAGAPSHWHEADRWIARVCEWASACARIVVNSPHGIERASALLDLDPDRFVVVPNGFEREFAPRPIDRVAHWRRHLVEHPLGWAPGREPGSVSYRDAELEPLAGTTLVNVGRFTEVKRLPLLIEAFADARRRFDGPAALVLLGGYPGEWEGEHPLETIERIGAEDVFLAGWHPHSGLPDFLNASDLLVHASPKEAFGQVVVEAMACGLPAIAIDCGGPAEIIDDGETGWLVAPDDRQAMVEALVAAVNDPAGRIPMGRAARRAATESYAWSRIGARLAELLRETAFASAASPVAAER
jgi:glycosyltransferase involved in cell wall biosynthesis